MDYRLCSSFVRVGKLRKIMCQTSFDFGFSVFVFLLFCVCLFCCCCCCCCCWPFFVDFDHGNHYPDVTVAKCQMFDKLKYSLQHRRHY